jgi:ComF family protein
MLGEMLASGEGMEDVDLIIPVPLHRSREKERGYNQSLLLAIAIGEVLEVPVRKEVLIRKRRTTSQTKLSAEERVRNVSGAFRVPHGKIEGSSILLVDDVLTTGATLNACTEALLKAGVKKVRVAAVACVPSGGKAGPSHTPRATRYALLTPQPRKHP